MIVNRFKKNTFSEGLLSSLYLLGKSFHNLFIKIRSNFHLKKGQALLR